MQASTKHPKGSSRTRPLAARRLMTIPGLVNAHTHTYMSLMRNAADDLGFDEWLFGTVVPIERRLEPKNSYSFCCAVRSSKFISISSGASSPSLA